MNTTIAVCCVKVKDFPLFIHSRLSLHDYYVSSESSVARITRADRTYIGKVPGSSWTVFVGNHSTYVPVSLARVNTLSESKDDNIAAELTDTVYSPVILDRGGHDGIRRLLFGAGFEFWLHRMLFLDALSFLSHGQLSQPLDRFILVDIDDVFMGHSGFRVTEADIVVRVFYMVYNFTVVNYCSTKAAVTILD